MECTGIRFHTVEKRTPRRCAEEKTVYIIWWSWCKCTPITNSSYNLIDIPPPQVGAHSHCHWTIHRTHTEHTHAPRTVHTLRKFYRSQQRSVEKLAALLAISWETRHLVVNPQSTVTIVHFTGFLLFAFAHQILFPFNSRIIIIFFFCLIRLILLCFDFAFLFLLFDSSSATIRRR